jgi:hypothetical protein
MHPGERQIAVTLEPPKPTDAEREAAEQERYALLRASFAGGAMQAILSRPSVKAGGHAPEAVAADAVAYADALLDTLFPPIVDDAPGATADAAPAETLAD